LRKNFVMKNPSALAAGALAALAMYFLDPALGRTRRARVRDNVFGKLSHLDGASAATTTDLRNRLKGLFARLRAWLAERQVPDEILAERVKAHLGRVVSHPGAPIR
jgi:hypothetical protein